MKLLAEAVRVSLPDSCDVAVVGGGASGLAAAIAAADAGARVVVLERDVGCGRTILATGNGRCNFSNVVLDPARFNEPEFVSSVCGESWLDDVLALFRSCGLRWREEGGRLYPLSLQAASVASVLVDRARRAGVTLAPAREVTTVAPVRGGWSLDVVCAESNDASVLGFGAGDGGHPARRETLRAHALVIATGGHSLRALDGLGIPCVPRTRVLCPVACDDSPLVALDGRRVRAQVSLMRPNEDRVVWCERGELLFRSYGLSGVVIFDLSRRAVAGDVILLDLVPEVSAAELRAIIRERDATRPVDGALDGVLDPQVAALLCRLAREGWRPSFRRPELPTSDVDRLVELVKALPLRVQALAEQQRGQVMRGGIRLDQLDVSSLGVRGHPGLFACGETLDVDGDCGGFNLSWAWKSGMVAGTAAASLGRSE